MARAWIFQANPSNYDIDGALQQLGEIWWRVPQYTGEVHAGDAVVLWRSGSQAGIVGVGRVTAEPQLRAESAEDAPFVLDATESAPTTRARLQVRDAPFVPKDEVRALPGMAEHSIVTGPMGTVFALSDAQWAVLERRVPEPPPFAASDDRPELPPPAAWAQRAKGVSPMPGGYSGYLGSLRRLYDLVEEERPTSEELAKRIEAELHVSTSGARQRESFLRKIGFFAVDGGICRPSEWGQRWAATGDHRIVVGLLHSRVQFVGELLALTKTPLTTSTILGMANDRYGMGWDTETQVANRRGWLTSAGMLTALEDGRLQTTAAGLALLADLVLHDPTGAVAPAPATPAVAASGIAVVPGVLPPPAPPSASAATRPSADDEVEALARLLQQSAKDSTHPDRFERAVRDAFAFLGFQAEWLGGSGRTDVLLDALLGKNDSYRAIVDCKTSASGSVHDQQVDWVTLAEHKAKHDAEHVVLLLPEPQGPRIVERAVQHHVTIIEAEQLAGLCRQHAKMPLGLDDYRRLFEQYGRLTTEALDERAEEHRRLADLTAVLLETVRGRSRTFGRLTARDLFLILAESTVAEGTSEDELGMLLASLASPLLALLDGNPTEGYRVTTSSEVARMRLSALGARMVGLG